MKNRMTTLLKTLLFSLLAGTTLASESITLKCNPQVLRGTPGEPLKVELTIETPRAIPARVLVPAVPNLVLRTVEKLPIQRTKQGRFVQKRIVIWQGLEAGSTTLTNLTVQVGTEQQTFPSIEITIDAVTPAKPSVKEPAE